MRDATHAFLALSPDALLDAVESQGLLSDGRVLALNSFENRVYQVGLEEAEPVVAKFYRPGRWSDEAILEEHALTLDLAAAELAVVAPWRNERGETLHHHGPFRFALYPRVGGRPPELDRPGTRARLGRLLARMHNVAAGHTVRHRLQLEALALFEQAVHFLSGSGLVPPGLLPAYAAVCRDALVRVRTAFEHIGRPATLLLHGDCHLGNILWRQGEPWLLDFDDSCVGPAVQDLWMLLSGEREEMAAQLHDLLDGYTQFRDFDARELRLIEPLRTLRMVRHTAWIGQRWDDPAFPRAFPTFGETRFWETHILALKEQLALMDEPPLPWP